MYGIKKLLTPQKPIFLHIPRLSFLIFFAEKSSDRTDTQWVQGISNAPGVGERQVENFI